MKAKQLLIAIVLVLFFQPSQLSAQFAQVKNYKMTVKGTSSLHDWESVVEKLDCKTSYKIENGALADIKTAVVQVPVESIKSPKGKMMDNKTYDAFNYEKHPYIIFTLSSEKINTANLTAELKGTLVMAGSTRPVDVTVTYKILPGGDLQISGSKKIKMTEFKMEPPTAMMGTIKVGDEVVITFDIVLSTASRI